MKTIFVIFGLVAAASAASPLQYEMCKAVVPVIKELVDAGETDLPKLVAEACFSLSWNPPLHKVCVDSLTDVIQAIVTALDAGLNSTQICVQIGYCSAAKVVVEKEKPILANVLQCEMCKAVVPIIKKLVDDGETDLPKLVNEACLVLSLNPPLHKLCVDELDDVIKAIVTYLDAGLNGTQICVTIGWCASSVAVQEKIAEPEASPIECELCTFAVKEIAMLLQGGETNIDTIVQKACDKLPGPLQALSGLCVKVLEKFVATIVTDLQNGQTEKEICLKINMCTSSVSKASFPWQGRSLFLPGCSDDTPRTCSDCIQMFNAIGANCGGYWGADNYVTQVTNWCNWLQIQDATTIQAVCYGTSPGGPYGPVGCTLNPTVCTIQGKDCLLIEGVGATDCIPHDDPCKIPHDDCLNFGMAHFSQLRQLFDGGLGPVEACSQINSCPKWSKPEKKQNVKVVGEAAVSMCTMCLKEVAHLQSMIANNYNKDHMIEELDKDCLELGGQAMMCITFVNIKYDDAVAALFAGYTVQQTCEQFRYC